MCALEFQHMLNGFTKINCFTKYLLKEPFLVLPSKPKVCKKIVVSEKKNSFFVENVFFV